MDELMKELVAVGAATAANCHPCLDHHFAKCEELGIPREDIVDAVKVGLKINHGAENRIRKHAHDLFGKDAIEAPS